MEKNSSKKLTKGCVQINKTLRIPKKMYVLGDFETFTCVFEYRVGYYVGSSFRVVRVFNSAVDASLFVNDEQYFFNEKLVIVCIRCSCYVVDSCF